MSERQRKSRDERLVDKAYRSEGLAPFFMHEDVNNFFAIYETGCVNEIAAADANDDDARRAAGMKLQAMRRLKEHMQNIISAGESAKQRLKELEDNE